MITLVQNHADRLITTHSLSRLS